MYYKKFLNYIESKKTIENLTEKRQESRYRLFLDDIMLIERIFPNDIADQNQIEEIRDHQWFHPIRRCFFRFCIHNDRA